MPTEIHAIARIEDGTLAGSIIRSISHVLSRWVRETQPLRGPVFAGPCHTEALESLQALRHEVLMLAWRPVELGLCSIPTHYPHGSLRIAMGLKRSNGFDARPMLSVFGDSVGSGRAEIKACLRLCPSEAAWRVWELTHELAPPGSRLGFLSCQALDRSIDLSAASLIAAGEGYGIDGALSLLETWVCAKLQPASGLNLHKGSGRQVVRGRALVACLAVAHRLCPAALVARRFQRSKSTLCEQMSACRMRPEDRSILATPLRRILEEAQELSTAAGLRTHLQNPPPRYSSLLALP